jgi:phosphoribosyl 1,2-cyclic phosphodiesterase
MNFESFHSGSTGNLYRVTSPRGSLLIEAGVSIKRIKHALDFKLSSVEACLISHSHLDHCAGAAQVMRAGIDCYMAAETAAALGLDGHRLKIVEPLKQVQIGGFSVLPFETQHDCPGSLGYLISDGEGKLLFATDTFYILHRFKGLTLIAVECNYSEETLAADLNPVRKERLYKSHFSLKNVKKFLSANDLSAVKEIHLIHLSQENSAPLFFRAEIGKLTGKPVYIAEK